jgi:methylated-DNA-protein-cysteine methyltransferase-like protein
MPANKKTPSTSANNIRNQNRSATKKAKSVQQRKSKVSVHPESKTNNRKTSKVSPPTENTTNNRKKSKVSVLTEIKANNQKKSKLSLPADSKIKNREIKTRNTAADDGSLREIQPSGKRDQSFFELVYEVARQIPYGRVTSYGAIAACLGTRLSARVVGYAMNGADKINPSVPAHRVVNRVGLLSGKHHFNPPGKMEKLLRKEGVLVKDDTIVNFKEKFWDPGKAEDLGI